MKPTILRALAVLIMTVPAMAQLRSMYDRDAVEHLTQLSSPAFEAKPDISDDRMTILIASARAGTVGGLDLWESTRPTTSSPFGTLVNVAELNTTGRDHTPTTSADGLTIVYSSDRPGGLGTDDAWMATRPSTGVPWSPPFNLPGLSSGQRDMGFTMTPDGLTLYFTSNRPGIGEFDLYTATRPDTASPWSAPTPVFELNTPWNDKFPSVTGDNLTLYFASDRPGSVEAAPGLPSLDLWVAMRASVNEPWSIVENVYEINTEYPEYLMSVANDDSELFFVSDRPGSLGGFDLYRTTAVPSLARFGRGTWGHAGVPRIRPIGGAPQVGNANWGYEITNVSPFAFGFYVVSFGLGSGPFYFDVGSASVITFQAPSLTNPSPETPRIINAPIPNDPAAAGTLTFCQVVMAWDLSGQGTFAGVPFSASPGLGRIVLP